MQQCYPIKTKNTSPEKSDIVCDVLALEKDILRPWTVIMFCIKSNFKAFYRLLLLACPGQLGGPVVHKIWNKYNKTAQSGNMYKLNIAV